MGGVTVFKPCEKKCGKCEPCEAFQKVVKEIDLTKRSLRDRIMEKPFYARD